MKNLIPSRLPHFRLFGKGPLLSWRLRRPAFIALAMLVCLLTLVVQTQLARRATPAQSPAKAATPKVPAPRVLSSGQVKARRGVKHAQQARGPVSQSAPQFTKEEREEMEEQLEAHEQRERAPLTGTFPGMKSTSAPTVPSNDPPAPAPKTSTTSGKAAPTAPNDLVIPFKHDLSVAETGNLRENTHEPTLGNLGGTLFYAANRYAARSTDGGQTFSYVSPLTTFPSVNGGFCCDQVVTAVPAQNMMIWSLQYLPANNTNTLRLARAVGPQVADNFWKYYDFTPQYFGFPLGTFMDFPTLTLSTNYLYVTSNVGQSSGNPVAGSVVMRILLSELVAGGDLNPQWFKYTGNDTLFSPRCTEGATTTMYWAGLTSNSTMRIFNWPDASGTAGFNDVAINGFTPLARDGVALSPDGTNWAGNALTKILAAWVRQGTLGFMWPVKQNGTARPFPYTIVAQFNETTRAPLSQNDIFSSTFAWLYPSVAVNAAGNLGGVLAFGGGSLYPSTALFLVDDVSTDFNPANWVSDALSTAGPFDNTWGDYLTVRPHQTNPNTFVAGYFYLSGATVVPRYARFGRERDFPTCTYSLTPGSASPGVTGGAASLTVTTGESCNWSAQVLTGNASWLTLTGNTTGSGNGPLTYSVAANTGGARSATIRVTGANAQTFQDFTVNQAGCAFAVNPPSQNFTPSGGAGSFALTTTAGCVWTAQSNAAWLTLVGNTSGSGNSAINFNVAVNDSGTARSGAITVGGVNFNITQAAPNLALYALAPTQRYFLTAGGAGSIAVTAANNSPWTAQTSTPWINLVSGTSGNGNGTVNYTVNNNNTGQPRTGLISVAEIPFVVTQGAAGTLLEATFDNGIPAGWTTVDGGTGGAAAATWTPTNPCQRTPGAPFSGNFAIIDSDCAGDGNTQDEQLLTPVFNATGFSQVVLEFNSQFLPLSNNEMADVDVSTNGGAAWTNVLRLQGVDDGFPAPVTRTVNITGALALNPTNVQIRFRYHNASWAWWWAIDNVRVRCSYIVSPTTQSFDENSSNSVVSVTTDTGCPWTAVSNDPSWLTITTGATGAGSGNVGFTVAANPGPGTRTGTLTVAGTTVFIRQAAPGLPFETDFNGGLPLDWRVMNGGVGGGPASTWTPANPCKRTISGTFAENFAIMDMGANCPRNAGTTTLNEELMSPVINVSDAGQVLLEFSNQFRLEPGMNETGDVEVSTNNGATWINVLRLQGGNDGFPNANLKTLDITQAVNGNPSNVRLRFRYYGSSQPLNLPRKQSGTGPQSPTVQELWWGIDELKICKFKLTPTNQTFPLAGGTNNVINVTTGPSCKWAATSAAAWVTFPGATSGMGSGTLSYNVAANSSGAARTGSINIAGQSSTGQSIAGQTFTVNQAGCPALTLNPATLPNSAINANYSQTLTATPVGTYSFTLLPGGALPTGLNLSTGGLLSGTPSVAGVYNFTVKATAPNGCFTTQAYAITISNLPTISAVAATRQQGSLASNLTIANVSDADQAANTLTVTVNGNASATVNGVTVSGVSINAAGLVTASVATTCAATTAGFALSVTDSAGLSTGSTLVVTVTPNTAPTLSYNNQSVAPNGSLTINPATGPSDNGSLSIVVQNQGTYAGTISVNSASGIISLSNAAPSDSHTITLRATDQCGLSTDATFTLVVTSTIPTLGTYPSATVTAGGNTTVTPVGSPTNTASITASTSTNFKGTFAVNPTTGTVRVTDAHVAGTYTVTVTAFSSGGGTTTKTFTLTVNNPTNCGPASPVFSQSAGSPITVGTDPHALAVGDFNGDGRQDIATANSVSADVTILLGTGNGGFISAGSIGVGTYPRSLAVGDFNGDGKQDLAVVNTNSSNVTILSGDGSGGFTPAVGSPVGVGSDPSFVSVGDFNSDGKHDLAVTSQSPARVTILLGNGISGFAPAPGSPIVIVGNNPTSIALGEFNNDSKPDLAVANAGGNVTILLGNGSGGFTEPGGSPFSAGNGPNSIVAADFNNDGKQDLAVVNYSNTGNVQILLGDGTGSFIQGVSIGIGAFSFPSTGALGDFNGDGQQDLAVVFFGISKVAILLGNGSGGFSSAVGSPVNTGGGPYAIAVGDFNGDGKQDISTTSGNGVTILLNNCAPTITPVAVSRQQGSTGTVSTIATVSDAETLASLLTVTATNVPAGITITGISNTNGTITATIVTTCSATVGVNNVVLTVTDGNNGMVTANLPVTVTANTPPTLTYSNQLVAPNGSLTVIPATGPSDNGSIVEFLPQNMGTYTGGFGFHGSSGAIFISNASPPGTHTITYRAIDNCGAFTDAIIALTVDVVIPTLGNYPNAAVITGGNTTIMPLAAPTNATSITATTSTNFKGTLTVNPTTGVVTVTNAHVAGLYSVTVTASNTSGGVVTKSFALTVTSPANCPSGSFSFKQATGSPLTVGTTPNSVAIDDFNGDGKQDIAVANSTSNSVTVFLGNGNGGFNPTSGSPISVGDLPVSLLTGDFNGDGRSDLAVANRNSGNVTVLLGNGTGGFNSAPGSPISGLAGPRSIAAGDFNSDGKQDLVAANEGDNVAILLGNENGEFTPAIGSPVSAGAKPYSVVVGDFNSDGRQDLAVANQNSNNLTILLGNGSGGFSQAVGSPISVGYLPWSIAVGDFNGDAHQDLAVTSPAVPQSNYVTILLGNGNGGFIAASGSPISTGANPNAIIVGDFNGDDKQDLAVGNFGSNNVAIFLGNGNGVFGPANGSPYSAGNNPVSMAVGDFNSDGKQDLSIVNGNSANVTILLANCAPLIIPSTPLTRIQGSNGTTSIIATVSDAETAAGSLTVTATSVPANLLVTSITNTNGTITADVIPTCNTAVGANTVGLTVTDGNGLTATTNLTVNIVTNPAPTLTYTNQVVTAGNALTISPATGPSDNGSVSSIAVQSITPSAAPGTITVNNSTGVVSVSNNVPVGTYTVTVRATDNCGATTDAVFTLTVNAIIIPTLGTYTNATVNLGGSVTVTPSGAPTSTAGITAATSTNFKGVFSVNPTTGAVTVTNAHVAGTYPVTVKAVSSNGGTATKTFNLTVNNPVNCATASVAFSPALSSPVAVGGAPARTAVGDFNLDGQQDVAVISNNANNVTILLGNGNAGFSTAAGSPYAVGTTPAALVVGDFNGDGKPDLAVLNNSSNNITILLGNGTGGFVVAPGSPVTGGGITLARGLALGDFNSDGRQDLATANLSGNVSVLLGNGNGSFTAAAGSPFTAGGNPIAVLVGNFNGDAAQDLAVLNTVTDNVTILLGTGSGGFTAGTPVTVGDNPTAGVVADFNGDSFQDLAVANYNSNNVSILLGNGSGSFSPAPGSPIAAGLGTTFVTAGNFNGDGQPDLAVVNTDDRTILFLLGNSNGSFTPAAGAPLAIGNNVFALAVGDFNGDGKPDLTIPNFFANNVSVLLANCLPVLTPVALLSRSQGGASTAQTIATISDNETAASSLIFAATTVPPGLTVTGINNNNGTITADVTALCNATPGNNTLGFSVTDGNGLTTTANLTVNVTANSAPTLGYANQVVAPGGALTITPSNGPSDNGGILSQVLLSQGTFTGTVTVNNATGVVSVSGAAPTGTHTITVRATDNCGAVTDTSFTLNVTCPTISVNPASLANGTVGTTYSQTLSATGGLAGYTFAVTAGALPNGLTLTGGGLLSGTPTAAGTFNFTVTVMDANGCTGLRAYTVLVNTLPTISAVAVARQQGTAVASSTIANVTDPDQVLTTLSVTVNGATSATVNGVTVAGLSVNGAGVVSASVVASCTAMNASFNLTVTDAAGATATATLNVTVTANSAPTLTYANQSVGAAGSLTVNPVTGPSDNGSVQSIVVQSQGTYTGTVTVNNTTGAVSISNAQPSGTHTFTIRITDNCGAFTDASFTLAINCAAITVNPATLPNGTVGSGYSQSLTATGGATPYSLSVSAGTLPNGLTLTGGGLLSGIPTAAGTFNFTVTATDANGCSGLRAYTVLVNTLPTISAVAVSRQQGTAVASSTIANVTDPDQGLNTLAVTVNSGASATVNGVTVSGLSVNAAGVVTANVVVSCTATNASFTLTVTDAQTAIATATLNVTVTANSTPVLTYTNQSVVAGGALTLNPATGPSDNGSVASIVLQSQGTYTGTIAVNNTTGAVSLSNAQPGGTHMLTIRITDNCGTFTDVSVTLTVTCPTITVNPTSLPNSTVGSAYSQTFTQTGGSGAITWSVSAGTLPGGLSLNPTAGTLSGTLNAAGLFSFTVRATDANSCTGERGYSVRICPLVTLSPPILPNGTLGNAYSQTLTQTGITGTATFSVSGGTLPGGITLAANGLLAGTPTASGSFTFTARAADVNGCFGEQAYSLTIGICPTITVNPAALPSGLVGTAYSQTLTASGGNPGYSFTLDSGTLPTGLGLATNGGLSGTPNASGLFNFTVKATDATGCTGLRAYAVTICATITVNPASVLTGTVGTAYSQTFTQTGGSGAITWSVSAGTLPGGLNLNAGSGVLSGTPTSAGSSGFTVRATDANGCFGERPYTLTINPAGNGLQFYPLAAPVRLLDTRAGQLACSQPNAPIAGQTSLTQAGRSICTIPANAVALTGNITTVQSGGGFLTLYPSNAVQPTVASTNYAPNETINNVFTVGLGTDGAFKIFAFNTTEVVVDVTGYYAPPAPGGLYFHPLPKPIRLLETRAGQLGCTTPGAPIQGGEAGTRTQQARVTCDGVTIPSAALAIVGNATTVNPQGGGFLTLFPGNATRPLVAASNYGAGQIVNGPFSVGLAPNGEFKLYTFATTDLVVDVLGYYSTEATDANGVGLLFSPLAKPVRLLETRAGQPVGCNLPGAPLNGQQEYTQVARGICDGVMIPANALGMVGNATVVQPNGPGFLTLWPSSAATRPTVATANYGPGDVGNRHFIVGLGAGDGAFKIYSFATSNLVIDLSGYFAP